MTSDFYEKVLLDPVHGYIHVQDPLILKLINTKEFQRLRRVKQLGTTSVTFHGAVHNRFGHSVGVYEIARQICDLFERNYPSRQEGDGLWKKEKRQIVTVAALLHDLGHGAFSHTFEKLFNTNHEKITTQLITSPDTEVNQVLRTVSPDFPDEVASVISHEYDDPQVVQLISSQLDADRMDYLLRDSYYTGVAYGAFDVRRILRVIQPYQDGIRFDYAGMHAIEDYIIARMQMYMQVYFHPVSRAMEILLHVILSRASDLYQTDPEFFEKTSPFLVPFFKKDWTLNDYLHLDDGVLETYFSQWLAFSDDLILKDLSDRYLNRKPLKSVIFDPGTQKEDVKRMIELIEQLGYDKKYYTAINSIQDLPYDLYDPTDENPHTQIELVEKNGNMVELSEASFIIGSLTGKELGDHRLFFPSELFPGKFKNANKNLPEDILDDFHRYIDGEKIRTKKGKN